MPCLTKCLSLSMFLPVTLTAQTAARSESLLVVHTNGQPIPFASVSLNGGAARVTNTDGVLVVLSADDTLKVLVRRMGFEPFQGKVGRAPGSSSFRVTLTPSAQALKKVTVTERARRSPLENVGFYDRMLEVQRGAPTGEFFTPEEVDARASGRISQFLYASKFVKIGQDNSMGSHPRAVLYGRNNCVMTLLIDGVVIHDMIGDLRDGSRDLRDIQMGPWGKQRTTIDDVVNGQEVAAIEVYPSIATAPMSIASKVLGAACGIVAIWTGGRGG